MGAWEDGENGKEQVESCRDAMRHANQHKLPRRVQRLLAAAK